MALFKQALGVAAILGAISIIFWFWWSVFGTAWTHSGVFGLLIGIVLLCVFIWFLKWRE